MTEGQARTVTIDADALEVIRQEAATGDLELETGGILLGHPATDVADIRVVFAGDPGPQAIHEPRRFLRDRDHAQTLADMAWHNSRAVWIGEWHTHPVGAPLPSEIDVHAYLTHLQDPELGFTEFLSLVLSRIQDHWMVAAWLVSPAAVAAADLVVIGKNERTKS